MNSVGIIHEEPGRHAVDIYQDALSRVAGATETVQSETGRERRNRTHCKQERPIGFALVTSYVNHIPCLNVTF